MSTTIKVGCRIRSGLILHVFIPGDPESPRERRLVGPPPHDQRSDTYGVTTIDSDFWARWKAQHRDSHVLSSRAVFEIS
jgi:hypothetical protein